MRHLGAPSNHLTGGAIMHRMMLLALLPLATHTAAHHSRAPFLLDETFRVEGTVVELAWRSPHLYMVVDAPDGGGETTQWTFEGHSVAGLTRLGWQPNTFRVGDLVAVVANPNRDPSILFGLLDNVTGVDGETYYSFRIPAEAGGPPPRQALAGSTDFSGAWNRRGTLRQALIGGFGPPEGYPVNERGQAVIDAYDPGDSPSFDCQPSNVPGITLSPYTHRWIREAGRIVIEKDQSSAVRVIHLDGSDPPRTGSPIRSAIRSGILRPTAHWWWKPPDSHRRAGALPGAWIPAHGSGSSSGSHSPMTVSGWPYRLPLRTPNISRPPTPARAATTRYATTNSTISPATSTRPGATCSSNSITGQGRRQFCDAFEVMN